MNIDELIEKALKNHPDIHRKFSPVEFGHDDLRAVAEAAYDKGKATPPACAKHGGELYYCCQCVEDARKEARRKFAREVLRKIDLELDLKCGMDLLTFEDYLQEQSEEGEA